MSERLAREIINNTPLSAGDRIDSASPDLGYVGTAYGEGRVSRAALDYAQQLYETGGRLPDPNSGGGGGGSDPTPDMASLCDFTDSDGFVTSVPSTPGGGITQDDITALITYQARGEPVPGCASSGGGGGGGGGGSDPAPDPQPTPDSSQLSARLENLSSFSPEQVTVYWSVTNEVTSGTGQQKSGTVAIDLDGRTQETQSVSISPGGTQSGNVRLADVSPGTREVCVRLQ
jgi:hypothetical protein